jgi:acyl-CoA reductase-like NAD-dependent aldehyde dehydrogenase
LLQQKAPAFITGSGISERILSSSVDKLQEAKDKGAQFLVGGTERASKSALKPTIITGVTKEMSLSDEEAFGPSFSLYVVKTEQEAVGLANDTQYGLNAAVHSTNMERALAVAQEIDTAQVHINSMTAHDERKSPIISVLRVLSPTQLSSTP